MRTKDTWISGIYPKIIKNLTPRIQKDLQTIPFPDLSNFNPEDSYYIHGEVETGKTILAAHIMLNSLKHKYLAGDPTLGIGSYMFISASTMMENISNSFSDPINKGGEMKKYIDCDILVMDDFGTFPIYSWSSNVLYNIINSRTENLRQTIITSNLPLSELSGIIGDVRITKRIERSSIIIDKQPFDS
jgi:DNA replication protein DnaC